MRATHLLFLIAILLSQVLCDPVYLSPNGSDEDGDGSSDKPYQTLFKVFNSTDNPTDSLEINVYPGIYGGPQNVGLNYTGALTINWYQNSSAAEGDSPAVQFDCTNATTASMVCIFSNTSITINGLDDNDNPQVSFSDCSTCLSVDNTEHSDDIKDDYVINIYGTTFSEVTQSAVSGKYLKTVEVSDSLFTDTQAGGPTLLSLINVDDDIKIQNTNFTSMNKNAISIMNTTTTEVENCYFSNSFIAISGIDDESQVVLGPNTITSNAGASQYVITLSTGKFTVKDSKVNTNGVGSVKVTNSVTASIINSTFEQAAALNGGALYFENVTTVTISEGAYFSLNTATGFGGAVYLVNSEAHLDTSNFTQNTARAGAAIGCAGNETVNYDNTTVFFYQNTNTDVNATDIQNTCNIQIGSFQSSLVFSSVDSGNDAWIWVLVSIAILVVILIIVGAVGFVIYQRKRQSYTRMD